METDGNEVHAETDAARAGATPHIVRWILLISLFAAIVLLSIIWITGAATQSDEESEVSVDSMAGDGPSEGTDSIVGENADEIDAAEPGDESAVPTVENETEAEPAAN